MTEQIDRVVKWATNEISILTGMKCKLTYELVPSYDIVWLRIIIHQVSGVTYADIKSKNRQRPIAVARFVYIWFLRHHFKLKLVQIAKEVSRDHTTVINALRASKGLIEVKDSDLYGLYQTITAVLTKAAA